MASRTLPSTIFGRTGSASVMWPSGIFVGETACMSGLSQRSCMAHRPPARLAVKSLRLENRPTPPQKPELLESFIMPLESKVVGNFFKIFHYIHAYPILGKYVEFFRVYYFFFYMCVLFKWFLMSKFIQYV